LTVVIPTLGRSILETCLYYLVTGSMWPGAVIVVDQGREEPVIRMIERLRAIGVNALLIPSHQSGRAAGLNRGLERVDTRFVAITDDDCFVANDWLETMSDRLHRTPARIITGRVDLAGDEDATFCVVTDREERLYTKPQLKAHPFIGGNVGMAMDLVDRIGFFDEHPCLASAEDSDYGYRALKLGIPIAYDPDVVLFHYHWRDAAQRTARYGDYARSQGGFYGTHLLSGDPLIVVQTLRALVRNPLRWLRGILARDGDLASNGRASTLNFLPGVVSGLMRRRKDLPGPKGDHGEGRNPAD
jgi:GT2 family glycosyltransferase